MRSQASVNQVRCTTSWLLLLLTSMTRGPVCLPPLSWCTSQSVGSFDVLIITPGDEEEDVEALRERERAMHAIRHVSHVHATGANY